MRRSICFLMVLSIVILVLSSCASVPKIQYDKRTGFELADNIEAKQTKEGISIELLPFNVAKEYKQAKYIQEFTVIYMPLLSTDYVKEKKEINVDYFYQLTPFEVEIVNNTNHILRMRDSRVAYIDPDSDVPLMALDTGDILGDYEILPVYQNLIDFLTKKYPDTGGDLIEGETVKALNKITKKLNFVNGFNREIMPGMRLKGIIVFPIDPMAASEGKVSFIDMVSKTDTAGNPIEKVRFDYRVKPVIRYFRYNKATDTDWKEIDESEYKADQTKP